MSNFGFAFHIPTRTYGPANADVVAPELQRAQPRLVPGIESLGNTPPDRPRKGAQYLTADEPAGAWAAFPPHAVVRWFGGVWSLVKRCAPGDVLRTPIGRIVFFGESWRVEQQITCPPDLQLRPADRDRIRDVLGMRDEEIDGYAARFIAARVAQGAAGERGEAQPDVLAMSAWLDQIACSVVKHRQLAGHRAHSGEHVVCPQGDIEGLLQRNVPRQHWVLDGVELREARDHEKAEIDARGEREGA
jgi:hypothetical protein